MDNDSGGIQLDDEATAGRSRFTGAGMMMSGHPAARGPAPLAASIGFSLLLALAISAVSLALPASASAQEANAGGQQADEAGLDHPDDGGTYVVGCLDDGGLALGVAGDGFEDGEQAQLRAKDGSGSLKWRFERVSEGVYLIVNARSGMALGLRGDAADGVDVVQGVPDADDGRQQWLVLGVRGREGFLIASAAAPQYVLGTAGAAKSGDNLRVHVNEGAAGQLWALERTSFSWQLQDWLGILDGIDDGGEVAAAGAPFSLSAEAGAKLDGALEALSGYQVGFVMLDLNTGRAISRNARVERYVASSIKGPYVAALNKYLPDESNLYRQTMEGVIKYSSNEAYESLRGVFGNAAFAEYMESASVDGWDPSWDYAYVTPLDLAKLWAEGYDYLHRNTNGNSEWCRGLYADSAQSFIREAVGGEYGTETKAGWIATSSYYLARNDAGIVMAGSHPYLVVVMSTAYGQDEKLADLVLALDAVHDDMVA